MNRQWIRTARPWSILRQRPRFCGEVPKTPLNQQWTSRPLHQDTRWQHKVLTLLEWASPNLNAAHFRSHQVIARHHHFDNDYQETGQLRGRTLCRLQLSIQAAFCGQTGADDTTPLPSFQGRAVAEEQCTLLTSHVRTPDNMHLATPLW